MSRDLEEALEMGVDWSLREGYAWAEDKEHCEEYGRMLQADPNKVSSKAKKRGLPQVQPHLQKCNFTASKFSQFCPLTCNKTLISDCLCEISTTKTSFGGLKSLTETSCGEMSISQPPFKCLYIMC